MELSLSLFKSFEATLSPPNSLDNNKAPLFHQTEPTQPTKMYLACYSRLALGIALPSLALYLTPRPAPGEEERETENIITRARQRLGGEGTNDQKRQNGTAPSDSTM